MSTVGDEIQPRKSKSKRALIVLLVILLVLATLAIGGFFYLRHRLDSQVQRADWFSNLTTRAEKDETGKAVNFLVLGADTEGPEKPDPNIRGSRSDVTMLVQLSADRKHLTVMSIPRDSWVPIPGHGEAKINAGLSFGGVPLAIETVEGLTGVHIDHAVLVNFNSFAAITDALGGVTITASGETKQMNGEEALMFARTRKTLPRGDFDRVRRQQEWMRAMASAAFSRDVLTSPTKLYGVLDTITKNAAVDSGLTISVMQDLAMEATDIRPGGIQFITAPYTGTGRSADGQSIVNLDQGLCQELFAAWAKGEAATFVAAHQGQVPQLSDRPVD
ncbi:MAG: LCP family protein [Bowdeniella nasicola]|nr:LCP family protein [Bowdeniella nasicola]